MATATPKKLRPNSLDRVVSHAFAHSAAAAAIDTNFFIADREYEVISIEEVHAAAGTDGGAVTLQVRRCQGAEAPSAGDALTTTAFNLKSTANTVVTGTLTATAANRVLAAGDRLAADFSGTLTALAGGVVTVVLRPTEV